jgi:hypothetical protein
MRNTDTPTPAKRPIKVRDVRTAKRLLSNIILQVQKNEILSETARLLVYCLSTYVSICKDSDFETRLVTIEGSLKKNNGRGK